VKKTIEIEIEFTPVRAKGDNGPCVEDIELNISKDELEKLVLDAIWDQHGDDITDRVWEET